MNESQEATLVLRCKAGDREAFRALVELHHSALFGTAYLMMGERELARDILQDAFVKIWRHFPSLQNDTRIKAWMVRIVANEAKQRLRRKQLPTISLQDMGGMRHGQTDSEEVLLQAEQRRSLIEAVNQLPPEQRQAVILRYFSELTVPQVAAAMHEREGTIKSRLSRAISRLRDTLGRDEVWQGR